MGIMMVVMGRAERNEPGAGRDEVRAQIRAEQRRLQSLVESLTANFDDLTEAADASPPDDEHDPEGHTIAFERSQLSGRRSEYLHAIAELAAAEVRLDDAQSSLCDVCGEPIPHERRLAVPTATRCVVCAGKGQSSSRLGRT
jgi:DnaK suppressor protein